MPETRDIVQTDYPAFARIPEALLFDPNVSPRAKTLFAILDRHACPGDECFPSRGRLTRLLGCSIPSVDRALRELRDRGWVTSHYDRVLHRNVFVLHASVQGGHESRVTHGTNHPCGTELEPENESQKSVTSTRPFVVARVKNGRENQQPVHPYLERLLDTLAPSEHDRAKILRAAHGKAEARTVNAYEASRGPGVRDPLAVALAELGRQT